MRTEDWADGRGDGGTVGRASNASFRPSVPPSLLASSPPSARSGLTLIEVMLAVAILGIGIAGMVMAGARCIGVARQARNYQYAREAIAQVEVEEPIALLEDIEEANDSGSLKAPFEKFRWERSVEPIGLEEDYLYQITTTIAWAEEDWKGSESVVTYVYRPDQKLPGSAAR